MKKKQTDKDRLRIMRKGAWRGVVGGTRLEALRADEGFQCIVALMRLANQIRFVNLAALQNDRTDSPPDRRQISQSFFFTCALVFEGWALAQRLAKLYKSRHSFKNGFGKLLKDKEVEAFVSKSLKSLRNRGIFHPDEAEIGRCLAELGNDTEILLSGVKGWSGTTYYELADRLLFMTLVGPCESRAEFETKYKAALKTAKKLLGQYLQAADDLIFDVLMDAKPRFESVTLTHPFPGKGTAMERAFQAVGRLP